MVQLASFVTPAEYLGKQAALQALCTRAADFDSDFVLHCPDDKEIHNCLKLDSAGLTTFVVVKQSKHPIPQTLNRRLALNRMGFGIVAVGTYTEG